MTRFTAPDLARLPAPSKSALTFEAYRAAYMADLVTRLAARNITYDVQSIEGDTYAKTGEAFAFRTLLVGTSIDDAISAVLLPYSWGPFLDALGATQTPAVVRQPIVASPRPYVWGTASVDDWQDDDTFRTLIQLAPETLSGAGPEGAYISYASSVPDIRAVAAYGPMSFGGTIKQPFTGLGEVHIPIVSTLGDGTATDEQIAAVQAACSAKDRRPMADFVTVSRAQISPYQLPLLLRVGSGADPDLVKAAALGRLRALADFQHYPGGQVLAQDVFAAAKVPDAKGRSVVPYVDIGGFQDLNATPITPATPAAAYVAPYCPPDGISVEIEVVDD
ncbi:baseplate J/gp47 family protein [Methylobacterium radiotolerans]|uniref:baseplate J/gp47 family protein n=1 Tax=Methylobacterium radiotolerans TaxID=31998 RepID=UPI001F320F79|nr:baseplate J/gp47 family protein [Methylobacterium radiotolerans]UIY44144.1 baseplate J/gp47 family protein [Methylobacterium radiotolerans]